MILPDQDDNMVIDMIKTRNNAIGAKSDKRRMRRIAGFTMAELLIVVAIIGVLAGVSFIAVQTHQRSMTQLQYDAIAKEIFVASQNHLTLAKSENYRQVSDLSTALEITTAGGAYFFGSDGDASADTVDDIRYFYSEDDNASTALEQILPFGSVELVTGGRYIIRYQPIAARVLDVFYWTNGDTRYDANLQKSDYTALVGSDDAKDKHENYTGNALLGWCGGEGIVETGVYLNAPEIEVINEEMLLVRVKDNNTDASLTSLNPLLKLMIEGNRSGAIAAIPLVSTTASYLRNGDRIEYDSAITTFTVVLDDITSEGLHFAELLESTQKPEGTLDNNVSFIPGENITIKAVAYSNTVLTSVAYSGEWTTNSLFGEVTENSTTIAGTTVKTADKINISNIRHLENLNDNLSSAAYSDAYFNKTVSAVQTVDLDWNEFKEEVKKWKNVDADSLVSVYDKNNAETKSDCFLPVTITSGNTFTYNGQSMIEETVITGIGENTTSTTKYVLENHSIKGIVVDNTGNEPGTAVVTPGGVFGSLTDCEIKNLTLINTKVKLASGDAGVLAGTLENTTVTNVLAYNEPDYETELEKTDKTKTTVSAAASGNVGGLIGSATNCTIQKSAAALIVSSTGGDAGGLIGKATGGTITGCYSGGHTIDSPTNAVIYDPDIYNVTATAGNAGGLIGDAGSTEISYSYSTCSASGATVGGLIGNGSGQIQHSYCTGLVKGTGDSPVEGAFAAKWTYTGQTDSDDNHYLEIINEREDSTEGYTYLYPIPGSETFTGIEAIDKTAATFNDFCGDSGDWKHAKPYEGQTKLGTYYGGKYNLKTVAQLDTDTTNDFEVVEEDQTNDGVTTPADFVAIHHGDWPAPEIFVENTQ